MESPQNDQTLPRFWLEFRTLHNGDHGCPDAPTTAIFPNFSKLPTELRIKIWTYLVQPRIVIACCLDRAAEDLEKRRAQLLDHTTEYNNGIPVLLHISQEARAVGLRYYEQAFSWTVSRPVSDVPSSGPSTTYFNFALDALYIFGDIEVFHEGGTITPVPYFLRHEDTSRVQKLVCSFREPGYTDDAGNQLFGRLWRMADRFSAVDKVWMALSKEDEAQYTEEAQFMALTATSVIQRVWDSWALSTRWGVVNDTLVHKKMVFVNEADLLGIILDATNRE